jgi:hypothetical protein
MNAWVTLFAAESSLLVYRESEHSTLELRTKASAQS